MEFDLLLSLCGANELEYITGISGLCDFQHYLADWLDHECLINWQF